MDAPMDNQMKRGEQKPFVELKLLGRVSTETRGSNIQFPWFETSPPPYDRRCISC
jgi:hypothetical protein